MKIRGKSQDYWEVVHPLNSHNLDNCWIYALCTILHFSYTYWLGEQPVVAVTDYQKIIDTFQKDGAAYEGRLVSAEMDRITRGILKLSGQTTSSNRNTIVISLPKERSSWCGGGKPIFRNYRGARQGMSKTQRAARGVGFKKRSYDTYSVVTVEYVITVESVSCCPCRHGVGMARNCPTKSGMDGVRRVAEDHMDPRCQLLGALER